MSMDHPEDLGSASALEVPARPPGSGYNFRPRSRSATAPKNRRLGSVETPGAGSTLDLPTITPTTSPTPSGAGIPTHEINSPPFSHQMPHPIAAGVGTDNSIPMPDTVTVGVAAAYSTLISYDSTTSSKLLNSTLIPNSV